MCEARRRWRSGDGKRNKGFDVQTRAQSRIASFPSSPNISTHRRGLLPRGMTSPKPQERKKRPPLPDEVMVHALPQICGGGGSLSSLVSLGERAGVLAWRPRSCSFLLGGERRRAKCVTRDGGQTPGQLSPGVGRRLCREASSMRWPCPPVCGEAWLGMEGVSSDCRSDGSRVFPQKSKRAYI